MRVSPLRAPSDAPSELAQLRAQIGMQAVVLEALLRRLTTAEARVADLHSLVCNLAPPPDAQMDSAAALRTPDVPVRLSLAQIANMVVGETGVALDDLRGPRRTQLFAMARALFCAAAIRAKYSSPQIGKWISRDHSSVLAAAGKEPAALSYFAEMRANMAEGAQ